VQPTAQHPHQQPILNAHKVPDKFIDAHQPTPVTARIHWADDGEQTIDTIALSWTHRLVRVRLSDRRWQLNAVWVPADDVKRRDSHRAG
jgi:hypothetical protein